MDSWLIDKFESFAHKWQRLTGLDCFWLAKQAFIIKLLFVICLIAFHGFSANALAIVWMLNFPRTIFEIRLCVKLAKEYDSRSLTANKRKINKDVQFDRVGGVIMMGTFVPLEIVLMIIAPSVDRVFFSGWMIVCVLGAYFSSCDPLSPCESKIRQWIKGLRTKPLVAATEN